MSIRNHLRGSHQAVLLPYPGLTLPHPESPDEAFECRSASIRCSGPWWDLLCDVCGLLQGVCVVDRVDGGQQSALPYKSAQSWEWLQEAAQSLVAWAGPEGTEGENKPLSPEAEVSGAKVSKDAGCEGWISRKDTVEARGQKSIWRVWEGQEEITG